MDAISHRFTEIFMFLDMKKKIAKDVLNNSDS